MYLFCACGQECMHAMAHMWMSETICGRWIGTSVRGRRRNYSLTLSWTFTLWLENSLQLKTNPNLKSYNNPGIFKAKVPFAIGIHTASLIGPKWPFFPFCPGHNLNSTDRSSLETEFLPDNTLLLAREQLMSQGAQPHSVFSHSVQHPAFSGSLKFYTKYDGVHVRKNNTVKNFG